MIQVLLILAFLVVLLAIVFWPVTLAIGVELDCGGS